MTVSISSTSSREYQTSIFLIAGQLAASTVGRTRPTAQVDPLALRVVEAAVPAGHGEAGRQALDVPLERTGQRLVEVVEAEDQPPVRRRVGPEVRQVGVPHSCTVSPVRGALARSEAIRYAAPR